MELMDGNQAAAYISYLFSEMAAIYPITPSSQMAELVSKWQSEQKTNLFDQELTTVNANSEAAAIGIIHGSLKRGVLSTTYTSSQGLLLMIPTMYRIAGELLPTVIHVASRAITTSGQSIFSDHSDVMAVRQTGFAMLASSTPQEVMDFSLVAHASSLSSSIPFVHFFEGFQTSHQLNVVEKLHKEELLPFVDQVALAHFRNKALDPNNPRVTGMNHHHDTYFASREMSNAYYEGLLQITKDYMKKINKIRGTNYDLVSYNGDSEAKYVIVAMGAVCVTAQSVIAELRQRGEKVGLLQVRLYRPFPTDVFLEKLPKTVEKIAVLDRTKEVGASGEPLLLDVTHTINKLKDRPFLVGGRYGLGGKNVTPKDIANVFAYLKQDNEYIKEGFTLGIKDDISNLSIPEWSDFKETTKPHKTAHFFGVASDGTISKTRKIAQEIFDKTDNYVQMMTRYTAHKYGGLTMSQLRYGPEPIKDNHFVEQADYVSYAEYAKQLHAEEQGEKSVGQLMKLGFLDGTVPKTEESRSCTVSLSGFLPKWESGGCSMCNLCSYLCPHGAIRPFLVSEEEATKAPATFTSRKLKSKDGGYYRIQIAPYGCTGCGICVEECPKGAKALTMEKIAERQEVESENWDFAVNLSEKKNHFPTHQVFGSQLEKPLLEFSSACAGCGETIYAKLLTQLFGDRLMIANATGCSSIWGASYPSSPYTSNSKGQGPTWSTSLLENNGEFGLGIQIATETKRNHIVQLLGQALQTLPIKAELSHAMTEWLNRKDESEGTRERAEQLTRELESYQHQFPLLEQIYRERKYFLKPSNWIIGGDGWAYDIGFAGVDHVLTSNKDVNILVLDNENYANTGGQTSSATQAGTSGKFDFLGKLSAKKDLGAYGLTLGNVYVAQVTYSMHPRKLLKILTEAENFPGPSLIIAYVPCVHHGIAGGMKNSPRNARLAVECGYWANYHYHPLAHNKMTLDFPNPDFEKMTDYLLSQKRFQKLVEEDTQGATLLFEKCKTDAKRRFAFLKMIAQLDDTDKDMG